MYRMMCRVSSGAKKQNSPVVSARRPYLRAKIGMGPARSRTGEGISISNVQGEEKMRPVGGKGTGDIKGLSRDGMGTDEAGGVEPVAGIGWWLVVDG
jgi:hypothetical protein